mmetsp:Transcript_113116/g.325179  ORF Transcript_113116/g.325179 Transcript_113116/m.325179 type:complete len:210 (+) Transcript_113116:244-873(+)
MAAAMTSKGARPGAETSMPSFWCPACESAHESQRWTFSAREPASKSLSVTMSGLMSDRTEPRITRTPGRGGGLRPLRLIGRKRGGDRIALSSSPMKKCRAMGTRWSCRTRSSRLALTFSAVLASFAWSASMPSLYHSSALSLLPFAISPQPYQPSSLAKDDFSRSRLGITRMATPPQRPSQTEKRNVLSSCNMFARTAWRMSRSLKPMP